MLQPAFRGKDAVVCRTGLWIPTVNPQWCTPLFMGRRTLSVRDRKTGSDKVARFECGLECTICENAIWGSKNGSSHSKACEMRVRVRIPMGFDTFCFGPQIAQGSQSGDRIRPGSVASQLRTRDHNRSRSAALCCLVGTALPRPHPRLPAPACSAAAA